MKNLKLILGVLLALFIIITLIVSGVKKYKKRHVGEKSQNEMREKLPTESKSSNSTKTIRLSRDGKWKVVNPPDRIRYTGEYGEVYRGVIPGSFISIEDLTEPCCIKTKSGNEYCSDGTNDFGKNIIPISSDNSELRFKSQNGKTGYLNIYFWVPVQ